MIEHFNDLLVRDLAVYPVLPLPWPAASVLPHGPPDPFVPRVGAESIFRYTQLLSLATEPPQELLPKPPD